MKKLYSKKLGGEAFALDAAQLDTLKKAGYTVTREGEAEAWEKLAEEKKEDGSPKYIHAADNAQFWRELDADLRKILRDLEA